jgi:methylmalonyl-CoA mutase N-terminal domain/subunit
MVPDLAKLHEWGLAKNEKPNQGAFIIDDLTEKQSQLQRLADFHTRHAAQAPAQLKRLQQAVIENKNVFEVLMDAVRCCSLGQITNALFEVGGQYRRNM